MSKEPDKNNTVQVEAPKENNDDLAFKNNPYLEKAQKKFYADQWLEQLRVQLIYGKQKDITIENSTYHNTTISDEDEKKINTFWALLQKVTQLYDIKFAELGVGQKEVDVGKLKEQIENLQKDIDDVERDYFCECARAFYNIPRDVALKNKEMLSPYLAGRNYWKDLRVVGNTYNAIKNDTVTPQLLNKLANILTERHYS